MNDAFSLHAWVDESMQRETPEREGVYLLAAAVADPVACEPVREVLRELLPRGAGRLHWRHESAPRQRKIAAAIGALDLAYLVIIGTPMSGAKQERARRQCLERLLFELENLGVSRVLLEARTPSLNARDASLIEALRGRRAISRGLRADFGTPACEPMLWVPDAVAGAVSHSLTSSGPSVRDEFGPAIEEIRINLR